MAHPEASLIPVRPLTPEEFNPYGWLLGQPMRLDGSSPAFHNAEIDFWHQHIFDPGVAGETEVLWVNYRNKEPAVSSLEVHRLTQQAVVPLTGEIIQVVAGSRPDGSLDDSTMYAFRIPMGAGICMRAGCWHTTRVTALEVQCLMLTRRSTTIDLVAHLAAGSPLSESAVTVINKRLSPYAR